jgi:hypothetical protein
VNGTDSWLSGSQGHLTWWCASAPAPAIERTSETRNTSS